MCVQYIGGCSVHFGCSVHWRDIIIYVGDIMSTLWGGGGEGVFSTSEVYHEYIGWHHDLCVLTTPWMYSWYPLLYSWYSPMYWTPPPPPPYTKHTLYRVALLLPEWLAVATRRRTSRKTMLHPAGSVFIVVYFKIPLFHVMTSSW